MSRWHDSQKYKHTCAQCGRIDLLKLPPPEGAAGVAVYLCKKCINKSRRPKVLAPMEVKIRKSVFVKRKTEAPDENP